MELTEKTVLVLTYKGEDFWSQPVYQDQFEHLWKDLSLGECDQPNLCSVSNDEFDGEPVSPITREFIIQEGAPRTSREKKFQYMMLGRLRSDCEYYLGWGKRRPSVLPDGNERKHIEYMKRIWNGFSANEKPEWLTWEQILTYEKEMCGGKSSSNDDCEHDDTN